MKRFAIALLLVLMAVSAQAATIYDIQTGLVPENEIVDLYGVTVVAVRYNGVYVSEAPHAAYNGIWVYGPTDLLEGDVIDIIGGEYIEYYDLSEIMTDTAVITVLSNGAVPAPTAIDAATLYGDPEPYESCQVKITDGMLVTGIGSYGIWYADALDGTPVIFDDFWFDDATVMVGDCYNSAWGIFDYSYSEWKLHPYVDGVELTDCTVGTEEVSLETIKALYR